MNVVALAQAVPRATLERESDLEATRLYPSIDMPTSLRTGFSQINDNKLSSTQIIMTGSVSSPKGPFDAAYAEKLLIPKKIAVHAGPSYAAYTRMEAQYADRKNVEVAATYHGLASWYNEGAQVASNNSAEYLATGKVRFIIMLYHILEEDMIAQMLIQ